MKVKNTVSGGNPDKTGRVSRTESSLRCPTEVSCRQPSPRELNRALRTHTVLAYPKCAYLNRGQSASHISKQVILVPSRPLDAGR